MKIYPKTYRDFYPVPKRKDSFRNISAEGMTVMELSSKFNSFLRNSFDSLWYMFVCQIWLEQKLLFSGSKKVRNGKYALPIGPESLAFFCFFVGISPSPVTNVRLWNVFLTYFKDFYPDYEAHDPFIDRDYYVFPYAHVTLDFLALIYQVDNRLEMLEEAEKKKMTYYEFTNWAINWVLSYNDEVGEEIYAIKKHPDNVRYIKNLKKEKRWRTF